MTLMECVDCVPGAVDGMFALHQKYGTLPMAELIEPSIEMAQRGYALTPLAAELESYSVNDNV